MDFAFYRNNICIGGPNGEKNWGRYGAGIGLAANIVKHGPHCDFDFDALGTWNKPFKGKIGTQSFNSLQEMRHGPHERNGIVVELNIFPNLSFPEHPESLYRPQDLRPRPDANVVDAGQRLPNVNDNFAGGAPDIGAYEVGQPLPHYGPRPIDMDESTHQP